MLTFEALCKQIKKANRAQNWERAILLWDTIRKSYPHERKSYFEGSVPLVMQGHYDDAIDVITKGRWIFNDEKLYFLYMAKVYMHAEEYDRAKNYWKKLKHIAPRHIEAHHNAIIASIKLQQHKEALSLIESSQKAFPNRPFAWIELAELHMKKGEWQKAETIWEQLRVKFPDDRRCFLRGYICSLELGESEKAISILDEAIKKFDDKETLVHRAKLAMRLKRWQEAKSYWLNLVSRFPYAIEPYSEGYMAWVASGEINEAEIIIEQGMHNVPNQAAPWISYAKIGKLKKSEHIEERWLQALQIFPRDEVILSELSKIYSDRGDTRSAIYYDAKYRRYCISHEKTPSTAIDEYIELKKSFSEPGLRFVGYSLRPNITNSKYFNISCEGRVTIGQPGDYSNIVYIYGDSVVAGFNVQDMDTIASNLQQVINSQKKENIRVVNCGIGGSPIENIFLSFLERGVGKGDIVILCYSPLAYNTDGIHVGAYYEEISIMCRNVNAKFYIYMPPSASAVFNKSLLEKLIAGEKNKFLVSKVRKLRQHECNALNAMGFTVIDTQALFDRPHDFGEVFIDNKHLTPAGYRAIAEHLYLYFISKKEIQTEHASDFLTKTALLTLSKFYCQRNRQAANQINSYISKIVKFNINENSKIGAIVMNCNPFTLGHKYLIEFAAERVDFLYIFIVQEDLSFFSFDDRIELVRKGTTHLEGKVSVIPGGNFIISSITFKEYFSKENCSEVIDATNDVMIFGTMIAPKLNITHRFLGEEPVCNVTKQYNETLKHILPLLNINVTIIPRKYAEGKIISASEVRRCLSVGNWPVLKKMTPMSTYEYLYDKFGLK